MGQPGPEVNLARQIAGGPEHLGGFLSAVGAEQLVLVARDEALRRAENSTQPVGVGLG